MILICALCAVTSCCGAQPLNGKNVLIVYLSRTNNTKAIAQIIQKEVGGTLCR